MKQASDVIQGIFVVVDVQKGKNIPFLEIIIWMQDMFRSCQKSCVMTLCFQPQISQHLPWWRMKPG